MPTQAPDPFTRLVLALVSTIGITRRERMRGSEYLRNTLAQAFSGRSGGRQPDSQTVTNVFDWEVRQATEREG